MLQRLLDRDPLLWGEAVCAPVSHIDTGRRHRTHVKHRCIRSMALSVALGHSSLRFRRFLKGRARCAV